MRHCVRSSLTFVAEDLSWRSSATYRPSAKNSSFGSHGVLIPLVGRFGGPFESGVHLLPNTRFLRVAKSQINLSDGVPMVDRLPVQGHRRSRVPCHAGSLLEAKSQVILSSSVPLVGRLWNKATAATGSSYMPIPFR